MGDMVFIFLRHNEDKSRWWADLKTYYHGKGFSPWDQWPQTKAWYEEWAAENAAITTVHQFGGTVGGFFEPGNDGENYSPDKEMTNETLVAVSERLENQMGILDNIREMETDMQTMNSKLATLLSADIMPDHIARLALGDVINNSTDGLSLMHKLIVWLEASGAEDLWQD